MSEERFDRLENQLTQVIQGMALMQKNITVVQQDMALMQQNIAVVQQDMATKQDLALVQRTVSDIRTDISLLSERVDHLEVTTRIGIRDSIRNQRGMINNLNYDLVNQERASARLRSRVERLEDINNSSQTEEF